jgi:hypothetical protein
VSSPKTFFAKIVFCIDAKRGTLSFWDVFWAKNKIDLAINSIFEKLSSILLFVMQYLKGTVSRKSVRVFYLG